METLSHLSALKVGDYLTLSQTIADIEKADHCDRSHCIYANALDRTLQLDGRGYVRCDANEFDFTLGGRRWQLQPSKTAIRQLRRFDELGEKFGVEVARQQMDPITTKLKFLGSHPIAPKASPERKAQINAARNKKNAERRLRGEKITRRKRFTGV